MLWFEMPLAETTCDLVVAALGEERTLARVFALLDETGALAGSTTDRMLTLFPPPAPIACRKGCSWCCTMQVDILPPEAFRIAAYLRETRSAEALAALTIRMAGTSAQTRGLNWREHMALRLPCPLLEDGACGVYPVRYFTCRAHNSVDERACEDWNRGRDIPGIPVYAPQNDTTALIRSGFSDGLERAGLQSGLVELVSGVLTALQLSRAADRWLAGEHIF